MKYSIQSAVCKTHYVHCDLSSSWKALPYEEGTVGFGGAQCRRIGVNTEHSLKKMVEILKESIDTLHID
jgi:hypothetical protein